MNMTREMIVRILKSRSCTSVDLSKELNRPTDAIEEDLGHIRRSIRNDPEYRLLISPAICKLCNFQFPNYKIKAPTKCPTCKREKIKLPSFKIEQK